MSVVLAFEREEKRNWTLADEAAAINKNFDRLDRAENRRLTAVSTSNYARLSAGQGLITAKAMLKKEDPDASFEVWCQANINRSMRDCYQCMWLYGYDDPERAVWKERAEWSEAKAESRARAVSRAQSAAGQDNPVKQQSKRVQIARGIYRKMTPEERQEIKQAQEEIDNA